MVAVRKDRPDGAGDLFAAGFYKDSTPDGSADGLGRNRRGRVGLRAPQPPLCPASESAGGAPGKALKSEIWHLSSSEAWRAAAEREMWLDAVTNDPLLPGRILPSDYLGQQALVAVRKDRRRVEVLWDASRQLRTFNPEKNGAGRA